MSETTTGQGTTDSVVATMGSGSPQGIKPDQVAPQARENLAQAIHEGGWDWCANGREEWRWSKALPREKKVAYAKADAVLRHLYYNPLTATPAPPEEP